MKPFDLEKALAGNPVMLRDGSQAFVVARRPGFIEPDGESSELIGWRKKGTLMLWDLIGNYVQKGTESVYDIIGMWSEKEKRWLAVNVNGLTTEHYYSKEYLLQYASCYVAGGWQVVEIEIEV